jgi:hypothetical protein
VSEEQARRVFRELQALARADYGGNTGALLVVYGVEGFLRRVAASEYASKMTLKGGMLMAAISARRMTKDADLSTRGVGNEEVRVAAAVSAAHRELGEQVPRLRVRRAVVVAAQQPVDELCGLRDYADALRGGRKRKRSVVESAGGATCSWRFARPTTPSGSRPAFDVARVRIAPGSRGCLCPGAVTRRPRRGCCSRVCNIRAPG